MTRMFRLAAAAAAALALAMSSTATAQMTTQPSPESTSQTSWDDDRPATRWVAAWTASPMPAGSTFIPPIAELDNQTIRHIVRVSVGGRRVRVRLSNAFGDRRLRIGAAHVALHAAGPSIVPDSDRALTFQGQLSVTIPKGAVVLSDPVSLDVPTHGRLAVSVHIPEPSGPPTYHEVTLQTSYISGPGDFTDAIDMPVLRPTASRFWLSAVEVMPRDEVGVLAAFGDSITTGGRSTPDAFRTWPDQLSARLNSRYVARLSVLNLGVGCGRLLFDQCGQSGLARFDRDVLAAAGVTHVIIALGLNDIGMGTLLGRPHEQVPAAEIIAGLRQLIERARAQGLLVYGATLTPVGSITAPNYYTPENEAKRQAVNAWIRTSRAFDGVIDFDRVLRDPHKPQQLLAIYNSDDGIHPNDAGYAAMAHAIDLSMLFQPR